MTRESDAVKALFVYDEMMEGKLPSMRNRLRAMQAAIKVVANEQPISEVVKGVLAQKGAEHAND